MIRYTLKCANEHGFESWFKSAEDFGKLSAAGMVACPECQDTAVEKTLMAPQVRPGRKGAAPDKEAKKPVANAHDPKLVEAIREIREHVETNSDYVGDKFATEARAMHDGDTPARSIYGEVGREDAKKLMEDGVPALPLPFVPKRKTN